MVKLGARLDYFISIAVAAICTAVSVPFRQRLEPTDFAMVYVLGVILVSVKCRRSAAILNAILSVTAFYYFLLPVHDSFVLEDYTYLIPLIAMPVMVGDHVEGFLSLRDLLFADLQEKDDQVQQLNHYIHYT